MAASSSGFGVVMMNTFMLTHSVVHNNMTEATFHVYFLTLTHRDMSKTSLITKNDVYCFFVTLVSVIFVQWLFSNVLFSHIY